MSQNPFTAVFTRRNETQYGDPKKVGLCGAPQCHFTPLLMAMCVALGGLIFAGVGSCILGFIGTRKDDVAKALGVSLIVIGFAMMLAGCIFFVYDNYHRVRLAMGDSTFPYQPQESTRFDQPSTSYGAASPSGAPTDICYDPKEQGDIAPPPYDGGPKRADSRPPKAGQRSKASALV